MTPGVLTSLLATAVCAVLLAALYLKRLGIKGPEGRALVARTAEKVERSIWFDLVVLVLAVVLGVGVGFGVLKIFFPELLAGGLGL